MDLTVSEGGHLLANLELVSKWNNDEAVYLVKTEKEVTSFKAVKKIHKVLNHKKKEQMYYAYMNAGKYNEDIKKTIDEVVEKCEICKKN